MARWRKALIASSLGLAASATFVAQPASANTAKLVVDYECTSGIAGSAPVQLRAKVSIPTVLKVGSTLNLGWSLEYVNERTFVSPGYYASGGRVELTGNVKLSGAWNGVLEPRGNKEQGELQPDLPMTLPEGLSDFAHLNREGVVKIEPKGLVVDFVPPSGEVVVNDDEPAVKYLAGTWVHDQSTQPEFRDHLRDIHTSGDQWASAELSFVGTGIEYIGRRMRDVSRVKVTVGSAEAEVDPTKNPNGSDTISTEGNITLWSRKDLAYGPHKIKIENLDDRPINLDGFRVITREMVNPPTHHRSTCVITNNPGAVEVTVQGDTTPPTSPPPTTPPPTTPPPTNTPTNGPTTGNPTNQAPHPNDTRTWGNRVVTVAPGVTATTTATPTGTAAPKPVTTKYVKGQVKKIPTGGVDTGEAPERREPYGLMAGGTVLLAGSAAGGLVLRRRRIAAAGKGGARA
ncbi:hypothetical protein [Nonomuraea sp. NPDC046570]|uniref:hypothetical protein n=1 Tax=Nonomuraea sp. NPDC046570 TaxID=3155255 RepID=UPI0033FEBFF8